jgi:hypothetical protein
MSAKSCLEHQPVAEQRQLVGLFVDDDTISLFGWSGCCPRRPPHDSDSKPKRAAYRQRNTRLFFSSKLATLTTLLLLSLVNGRITGISDT